jgi:hypothetical protein
LHQQAGPPVVTTEDQQQQPQPAWLVPWQDQAPGSSGSGGSLGQLLGQVSAGYPALDTATIDVIGDQMVAAASWQIEPRLAGSRAPSPLDVLGYAGLAAAPQQQLPRQLSMPAPGVSGLRASRQPDA